jgi:hypothetical protein
MTPEAVLTMWTIEPVIATTLIKGNSTNVAAAKEKYSHEIEVIEPMASTSHTTSVLAGNEMKGRWASWLDWKASLDETGGHTSAVCVNCNMYPNHFQYPEM